MEMGPMHGAEGEAEGACCLFYTVLYAYCIQYARYRMQAPQCRILLIRSMLQGQPGPLSVV